MRPFDRLVCASIAVPDIEAILPVYTEQIGLEVTREMRESPRGFGMKWVSLGQDGKTFLELIAPTGTEGPVAGFLDKDGPSHVYQLRFEVDDIDEALAELESRGLRVMKGQDVPGYHRVGWIHPASTGGVLFELVQFVEGG